ncbi:hypothetical protein [Desulfonatronovibrio magnus]|nr:hypothetical protein [Desulfonatronovibrio magnus]
MNRMVDHHTNEPQTPSPTFLKDVLRCPPEQSTRKKEKNIAHETLKKTPQ